MKQQRPVQFPFPEVRVWQTHFEVHRPIRNLPLPDLAVEERQTRPAYRIDGRSRPDSSGSQFVLTIGGVGGIRIGGEEFRLKPGDAFLHNHADQEVCYFYPRESTAEWRFLWMAFEHAELLIQDFIERYGYRFHLPREHAWWSKLAAFRGSTPNTVKLLTPLGGAQIVTDLLTSLSDTIELQLQNTPQSRLVVQAQQLLLAAFRSRTAVADIASQLHVSREHLSRAFHRQTGKTVHEYLLDAKMELALNLLHQRQLSCKEIAEAAGFDQYSTFARAIKRRTGKSPETLRNN